MKITLKALVSFLAVASIITYSGCGGDPAPAKSIEDQQLEKLAFPWTATDATLDGVSKKTDYADKLVLTLTGTAGATDFNYSTTGRPSNSPWPSNGTWQFGTDPETQIVRDPGTDKVDMTYALSADGNSLQVNFTFAGTGYPARVSNVKGNWVFTFKK